MQIGTSKFYENKVIIRIHNKICETAEELVLSDLFREIVKKGIEALKKRNSLLLGIFGDQEINNQSIDTLIQTFLFLAKMPSHLVPNVVKGADVFLRDPHILNDFVEYLYNFWRGFDRFVVCDSTGEQMDKRPFRTFNATIGVLSGLVRGVYRDIQESISGNHPRIYRQVTAAAEVATISLPKKIPFADKTYERLNSILMIRQLLLYPPLILNPPMNKRTGTFERVDKNPLEAINIDESDWLCYPANVGPLLILIYFHHKFFELGHALCNLFQLAEDEDLERKPDAVYLFGVPGNSLDQFGPSPTIFYEDEKNGLFVAAVPNRNEFAYFGYLKKMVLTLHNIIMMKKGRLPFHGALVRLILKGNKDVTLLFIGDTGAGKSETLEALRELGESEIQDIIIIADDMGSLSIDHAGNIIGYGTEIGAFLRLDDLQPGYALGQIDRAIIMSANQINARIILPVTSFENVIRGQKIDFILYANNYEDIDEKHPIIEHFKTTEEALNVFRAGKVMSKGTTTTSGIVQSYFANIFGPPQYKDLHEPIAQKYFKTFFEKGLFVGQMRSRLGLSGWERKGPVEAAKELLKVISQS